MKIKIHTRQNAKGNWWANATYKGYDISEEGKTIDEARALFVSHLHEGDEPEWIKPVYYKHEPEKINADYQIKPQKVRIDHNPHG